MIERLDKIVSLGQVLARYDRIAPELRCRGCPQLGKNWACPPIGERDVDDLPKHYSSIRLVVDRVIVPVAPKEMAQSEWIRQHHRAAQMRQFSYLLAEEAKYSRAQALQAGSCALCSECARVHNRQCVEPAKWRRSFDTLGLDVASLLKSEFDLELRFGGTLPQTIVVLGAILFA